MSDPVRSVYVVTSPELAVVLARGHGVGLLRPYFDAPTSIAEAARELDEPLARVHRWTHRWHDLGVLRVVETQARKGRPIRRYRTIADVIEVPPHLMSAPSFHAAMDRVNRRVTAAVSAAMPQIEYAGTLRIHKPPGHRHVSTDRSLPPETRWRRDVLQTTFEMHLRADEAARLLQELQELRDRWLQPAERSGRPTHIVSLAVSPVPPQ